MSAGRLERFVVYATPDESAGILVESDLPIEWLGKVLPAATNPTGLPLFLERGVLLRPDNGAGVSDDAGALAGRVAYAVRAELSGSPVEARPTLGRLAERLAKIVADDNEALFLAACQAGVKDADL